MKSIIISILMLMSASAISAQSTYLKISLAKNYTEAANILKTSIDTLNNKERAKCYNELVYKNNKVLNAIYKEYSFKKWGRPNRFSELLSESIPTLVQTCKDALSCAEYDTKPDEKGKIKPKFLTPLKNEVLIVRPFLVSEGIKKFDAKDYKMSFDCFSTYIDISLSAIISENPAIGQDDPFYTIAYYAAYSAYMNNDALSALKYIDIAQKDPKVEPDAKELKEAIQKAMKKQ